MCVEKCVLAIRLVGARERAAARLEVRTFRSERGTHLSKLHRARAFVPLRAHEGVIAVGRLIHGHVVLAARVETLAVRFPEIRALAGAVAAGGEAHVDSIAR